MNENNTTRRQFLQSQLATTAGVATGLALGSGAAFSESETLVKATASDRTVRIGLVGCGGRGTGAINDSLTINANVKLVAVADLHEGNAERTCKSMSKRHEGKVNVTKDKMHVGLDAYKRVLDDPDVDLVVLATSPGFRPRHIAETVDAGKHIFAEKPACVDPTGYRICVKAHEKAVQ